MGRATSPVTLQPPDTSKSFPLVAPYLHTLHHTPYNVDSNPLSIHLTSVHPENSDSDSPILSAADLIVLEVDKHFALGSLHYGC